MAGPDDFRAIENAAEPPSPEARRLAEKEETALADGSHKVRKEVHAIAVWALRFGAILIACVVLVRVWHLVGPDALRWLNDGELQSIDKILFSSAFGGLVLGYLKEIMRPLPK